MTPQDYDFLRKCLKERSGLVLSGGVGFGTSGSRPIGRVAVGWLF